MPLVESVAGSRRAVKAVRTATLLSYIGAAAGVALAYYLTSVGNFALLTPIAMVLYQVLWLLPTLLLAGLVKHLDVHAVRRRRSAIGRTEDLSDVGR